jgi:quercetin dioxygenase-like cupin family protein
MRFSKRELLVAGVGAATLGATAVVAFASPPSGITTTNLVAEAEIAAPVRLNSDRIKLKTKRPTDVRVQTLTFEPGGRTGWHHHPGIVVVAVQSGRVTVFDKHCDATTYGPGSPNGSAFTEAGDHPMEVRNQTDAPATVYATFLAPDADPPVFRIEDAPRHCD